MGAYFEAIQRADATLAVPSTIPRFYDRIDAAIRYFFTEGPFQLATGSAGADQAVF